MKTAPEIKGRNTIGCTPVQIAGGSALGFRPRPPGPPPGTRPLNLLLNTLLINGHPGPVRLQGAESATVTWSLPAGRDADGIYLLVSNREFTGPCSSDVASFGDSAYPDSGYHPGAPSGSHELALDHPMYRSGVKNYVKGCLWRGGAYTGDETNTVELQYTNIFQAGGLVHCLVPPCEPELRVNGNGNEVWVSPGEPPTFEWNLRRRPTGEHLFVYICEHSSQDYSYLGVRFCPLFDRIHELPQGRVSFPLDRLQPGHTYYVSGSYNGVTVRGIYLTNVVRLHYDWSRNVFPPSSRPNLSVARMTDRGAGRAGAENLRRLEFTVRTQRGLLRSSTLRATYPFAVYLDEETTPRATGTIPSAHVAEGRDETVSVIHTVPNDELVHLVRLVINSAGDIPERDYNDNTAVQEFQMTDRSEGIRDRSANRIIDVRKVAEGPNWVELEVTYTSHGSESRLLVRRDHFSRPRIGLQIINGHVGCHSGAESYYTVFRDSGGISDVGFITPSTTRNIRFVCRVEGSGTPVSFPFDTSEVVVWMHYGTWDQRVWRVVKRWVAGPTRELPDLRLVYFEINWRHRPTYRGSILGHANTVTVTVKNSGQAPSVASAVHVFKEVPRDAEGLDVGQGWWWPFLYIGPLNPGQSETQTRALDDRLGYVEPGEWIQVRLDDRNEVIEGPAYANQRRFEISIAASGAPSRQVFLDERSSP
jgi:hypothetical protein